MIVTDDIESDVHQAALLFHGPAGLKAFPGIVMITLGDGTLAKVRQWERLVNGLVDSIRLG